MVDKGANGVHDAQRFYRAWPTAVGWRPAVGAWLTLQGCHWLGPLAWVKLLDNACCRRLHDHCRLWHICTCPAWLAPGVWH